MAWRGRGPWSVCVYGGEESEGMEDWRGRPQVKIGHAVGLGSGRQQLVAWNHAAAAACRGPGRSWTSRPINHAFRSGLKRPFLCMPAGFL